MSIIITNVDPNPRKTGLHRYAVRINNQPIIAEFDHYREDDLTECLRLAADAVEARQRKAKREERTSLPVPLNDDTELIKEIAMDIGKEVVAKIDAVYPAMFDAVAHSAKVSIRNTVFNEIIAALGTTDAEAIRRRLDTRKKSRREWVGAFRKIRQRKEEDQRDEEV